MAKLNILEHSNVCDHFSNTMSKVKVEAILEKEDVFPDHNYVISVFAYGISENNIPYLSFLTDSICSFQLNKDNANANGLVGASCTIDLEFKLPESLNTDMIRVDLAGFPSDMNGKHSIELFTIYWKYLAETKIQIKDFKGENKNG